MPAFSFAPGEKIFLFGGAFTNCQPLWNFKTIYVKVFPGGALIKSAEPCEFKLMVFSYPSSFLLFFKIRTLMRTLPLLPLLLFNSRIPMFSQAAQAAFLFLQDLRFGARIAQV